MMYMITIPGQPVGKGRPRFSKFGVYTPEKTAKYEKQVRDIWCHAYSGQMVHGPVSVDIIAYYRIPASWSKQKKADALAGKIRPEVKPDVDNVAKVVLDALNGSAYEDDKSIITLTATKAYSDDPRVVVSLCSDGEAQL